MRSLFKLPTCFESCQEINNGRIAMFAIMGQIVAELQTGKGPVEQFMGWEALKSNSCISWFSQNVPQEAPCILLHWPVYSFYTLCCRIAYVHVKGRAKNFCLPDSRWQEDMWMWGQKMGECRHLEQYRFYECSACGGSQDFATSFLNVFHLPWLQLFVHVYLLMLKTKI